MSAHGYGAYTRGCRCEVCREAKRQYQRNLRSNPDPSKIRKHGVAGYQNHGCRCEVCVAAHRAVQRRQYAARKVSVS